MCSINYLFLGIMCINAVNLQGYIPNKKKHAELKIENYKYEYLCMHAHSIPLGYLSLKHQIYTSLSGTHHLHMSQNFLYVITCLIFVFILLHMTTILVKLNFYIKGVAKVIADSAVQKYMFLKNINTHYVLFSRHWETMVPALTYFTV